MYPPGGVQALCDLLVPLVENARAEGTGRTGTQAVEKHFSFDRMLNDFRDRVL
jgi:hypothetical protein